MTSSTSTAYLYEADAVPAGPPPPSQLRWKDATPEQLAFMQDVYRRHVAAVAKSGRRFVASIPPTELGEIERGICMRRAAAAEAKQLLDQARQDWQADRARGDPKALRQGRPGLNNAYRSPELQFVLWQRYFPKYYKATADLRRQDPGGEHGPAAADRLAYYVRKWVGAPGYSLHQDGLAMDLEGGSLGPSGSASSRQAWGQSWYWDWLVRNAARYHFQQNTSINEPWHWQYFGGRAAGPSVPPGQPGTVRPDSSPRSFVTVDQVPVLARHRGRPPALVIGWNAVGRQTRTVDIVVHFHGFSPNKEGRMQLQVDMLPVSGLDFSDPAGSGARGRTRPTIYVMPRGSHAGGMRYLFPAMERPDTVRQLVGLALDQVRARFGAPGLRPGRLIFTAHSGGGAGLLAALAHNDPDEVHVFDGLYEPADNLIRWASARIRCEQAACNRPKAALRVIYLRGSSKTTYYSGLVRKALQPQLDAAPALAADLKRRFRVEETTVPHMAIPRTFGWRLLADATADLPLRATHR
jgi:D-alanyl-D-alanine carboxypeptidase